MTLWPSAAGRRLFMAAVAAVMSSCNSTVDHLGYMHQVAGAGVGAGAQSGAGAQPGTTTGSGASTGAVANTGTGGTSGGTTGASSAVVPSAGARDDTGRVSTVLGHLNCSVKYTNTYSDVLGLADSDIRNHLWSGFNQLFHGPDEKRIYVEAGENMAVVVDVLHDGEVRTEGMGLAMIVAAMLGQKPEFDRLWRFARDKLQAQSGPFKGYYVSHCNSANTSDESDSFTCYDPYGFQQFVMALLLARERWAVAADMDYTADVLRLFDVMRNKEFDQGIVHTGQTGTSSTTSTKAATGTASGGTNGTSDTARTAAATIGSAGAAANGAGAGNLPGGSTDSGDVVANLFDDASKLVYIDPTRRDEEITSPSFEIPGYYAAWSQVTGDTFYTEAAAKAREFLAKAANKNTGLLPVRATFDGLPVPGWSDFSAEAYRALLNIAIDRVWGTAGTQQNAQLDALMSFFIPMGDKYGSAYTLDGKTAIISDHRDELVLVMGVVAAVAKLSYEQKKPFIEAAYAVPIPTGLPRYYRGILYLVANLILSGQFRLCSQ